MAVKDIVSEKLNEQIQGEVEKTSLGPINSLFPPFQTYENFPFKNRKANFLSFWCMPSGTIQETLNDKIYKKIKNFDFGPKRT